MDKYARIQIVMTFIAGAGIFGFLVFVTRMIYLKLRSLISRMSTRQSGSVSFQLLKKSAFLALFVDHGMGYRPLWIVNAILAAIAATASYAIREKKEK